MIETTVLYSVAAVVVAGLAVWVAVVLAKAKEPWARPLVLADAPPPGMSSPDLDADATEKATPLAKAAREGEENGEKP